MKPVFVETRNYNVFLEAIDELDDRGSDERRLIIVDGLPGLGKTTILSRWAANESCIYLRGKSEWTSYWLMAELLTESRQQPDEIVSLPHGFEARFGACLAMLAERRRAASAIGAQFAVVIDEADYVSAKSKLVDTVRDLADLSQVPFILVGMGKIRANITRHPQTASRIAKYVRFEPADLDGVKQFLREKCEIAVAPDLASFVHRTTGGFNRELLGAIKSIERFGYRNPPPGEGMTLRDMAGQHLINDRQGQPISVPAIAMVARA